MPGPKPKRAPADTTRLKADMAADKSLYEQSRAASVAGYAPADAVAKQAFGSLMARSDSLDRARSTVPDRKKLTNHAAHGDSVTFPASAKHQRQVRCAY